MAAFAVIACEEEFVPHVDFTPADVTLSNVSTDDLAAPVTFDFTANAAWTASLKGEGVGEWLSISPKKGEAGDASIKFTAMANDTKEDRTATLEIIVEGLDPILVNVTQLQTNAIDISGESAYTLSFNGETVEIEVGHNVEYSYELTGGEWLVETKAYATDKLVFTAPAQEVNAAARKATLAIYTEHDGIKGLLKSVTITQEAWSPIKWTNSLSEMGAAAGRVGVAVAGDKVYFTANGELWTVDEATGANATKVTLPEGFVAGSVHADDAGNLLVSGPDRQVVENPDENPVYDLKVYLVEADGYKLLIDYAANNFSCNWMGNFRVKGNVKDDALITAYVAAGPSSYTATWTITDGVVAPMKYYSFVDGSWATSTGVVAPAGSSIEAGLFSIAYGAVYDLYYFNGTDWVVAWDSPGSWMENWNCISTAEVNGTKYLALTASCHFNYDFTDLYVLDITNPAAATKVFNVQIKQHTANEAGLTYCDVYIKAEGDNLAAYVIDPWMDTVEKYLFPLQVAE
jgi:hypothetical protein